MSGVVKGRTDEEVWFNNREIRLAGLLMIPHGEGPHPAVVFIHGSGYSDRTNRWYLLLADYLAERGIAVLLPDKRGSGQSGGDWREADFNDLAGDSLAAIELLRSRAEVDERHVGLLGISQGGWIAPLVADRSEEVSFVISVSGAAVTPGEQFVHQVKQDVRAKGLPGGLSVFTLPVARFLLKRKWKRWEDVAKFDPIPFWTSLRVPVLIIFGGEDEWDNVPVKESVRRLEEAVRASGQPDFAIKVFPGSGHGLYEPGTKEIRADFLQLLARWIREATNHPNGET